MSARGVKRTTRLSQRASAETGSGRLRLGGPGLELEAPLSDGTFAVIERASGWAPLPGVFARVETEDGRTLSSAGRPWALRSRPRRFDDGHGRGVQAVLSSAMADHLRLHLELSLYDSRPFALVRLGLENAGRDVRRVRSLTPLAAGGTGGGLALATPRARWRWYRHGWQSWTPSLSLSTAQQDIDVRPPAAAPTVPPSGRGVLSSEEVTALLDPSTGRSLVVGFVTARQQWTQVRLDAGRRAIDALALADGAALPPGETLWSERLLVDISDDVPAALGRYAEALAREMGARVPSASPAGWCSWYYYFWNVTEEEVLKNLRFLQEHRDRLPLQYVQIDDGYQANIGDWTTANEKFPHGMGWLAEQIRDAGFTPGLWLAPLLVGDTSRLFAEHPDWMVRGDDGAPVVAAQNWNQECYGLDCTHPGADAWLRDLFRQVTDGWRYDYVKVDFLYGGAIAGRRYDSAASRIEAYRRGLSAIRQGVGERFVLGCGALMGPSVGLVDAQRIGPDVAPWWRFWRSRMQRERGRPLVGGEPATENALRNVLARSWMHGRLWTNDPDCLLARRDRTKLTLPEAQSLATAIALSGGAFFASDDLTQLSPERLALVSSLLPLLGDAASVPDLMTEAMPSTIELDVTRPFESWRLLARFNWQRRRRPLPTPLPPGRWHVFEFWDRRYYGLHEGELLLAEVPAHGVRLLALRRAQGRPQVLATSFHYSMGGQEIADCRFDGRRRALRVALRPVAKRRGEVFIFVPEGYRLVEALLNGERLLSWRQAGGVLALHFSLEEPSTLVVRFA